MLRYSVDCRVMTFYFILKKKLNEELFRIFSLRLFHNGTEDGMQEFRNSYVLQNGIVMLSRFLNG